MTLGEDVRVAGTGFAPNSAAVRITLRATDGTFTELGTSIIFIPD